MKKKFVVYKGEKITLEWYFDSNGNSKARESFMELPLSGKKKLTLRTAKKLIPYLTSPEDV
mgnify:CR=1 FL=1